MTCWGQSSDLRPPFSEPTYAKIQRDHKHPKGGFAFVGERASCVVGKLMEEFLPCYHHLSNSTILEMPSYSRRISEHMSNAIQVFHRDSPSLRCRAVWKNTCQ